MNAQWKKFDGSEEQISEIYETLKARGVISYKLHSGNEYYLLDHKTEDGIKQFISESAKYVDQYRICQPHPHADMIIEWARTGRAVYVLATSMTGEVQWFLDSELKWHPDNKYSFSPG